jgi:hypothetical protein
MGVQDYPLSFYLRILSQPKRQDYRSHNAEIEGSRSSLATKINDLALYSGTHNGQYVTFA